MFKTLCQIVRWFRLAALGRDLHSAFARSEGKLELYSEERRFTNATGMQERADMQRNQKRNEALTSTIIARRVECAQKGEAKKREEIEDRDMKEQKTSISEKNHDVSTYCALCIFVIRGLREREVGDKRTCLG